MSAPPDQNRWVRRMRSLVKMHTMSTCQHSLSLYSWRRISSLPQRQTCVIPRFWPENYITIRCPQPLKLTYLLVCALKILWSYPDICTDMSTDMFTGYWHVHRRCSGISSAIYYLAIWHLSAKYLATNFYTFCHSIWPTFGQKYLACLQYVLTRCKTCNR